MNAHALDSTEFEVIEGQLYLSTSPTTAECKDFSTCQLRHIFEAEDELVYVPFCDDFGPLNLSQIFKFCEIIEAKKAIHLGQKLVYCVKNDERELTNAVFLAGSYLMLALNMSVDSVCERFNALIPQLEMYRDATFSEDPFRLNLIDCWNGFARARSLGWIDMIDLDEYVHYDNPLEGDLHWTVPDKLIAFKGPHSLPNGQLYSDVNGYRKFSPGFYTDAPFADMGVKTFSDISVPVTKF
jgi:cell division cycle 14